MGGAAERARCMLDNHRQKVLSHSLLSSELLRASTVNVSSYLAAEETPTLMLRCAGF